MSRKTPPAPTPPDAPEPAEVKKAKRTLLQAVLFFGGVGLVVVLALAIVAAVGGRMYLLSGPGRELVTSFVAGKKIGRYGRINVEGLSGDLFDDFTLQRVTVTDQEGVWLEARNVRVDWNWLPLIGRRFQASEIDAEVIRLIRRPLVEPSTEPPGPQPLSIDIDRFSANVELLEGFSQEYGRWRLTGDASVPRKGDKKANIRAVSNTRPGDFLNLAATIGDGPEDLRLNLVANEGQGGPLAGSLGYSPNAPFSARAIVNGRVVNAVVRTGEFTPLNISGSYGPDQTRISGYADFSGSDLLKPFAERIGQTARFGLVALPDTNKDGVQEVGWRLIAENLDSTASGQIRLSDRTTPNGIKIEVATPSLTRLAGAPVAGPSAYAGTFQGDAQTWSLTGAVDLRDARPASYHALRIMGPLNVQARAGRYDLDGDLRATGGSGEGVIGALLGATPRIQFEAARQVNGALLLEKIDARGQALELTGSGGRSLTGGLGFRGNAVITDIGRIHTGAKGRFGGPITASQARPGAPWQLTLDGRGQGLRTGLGELDRLLGATPRFQFTGGIVDNRVRVDNALLTGAQGRVTGQGLLGFDGGLRLALAWNANGPFGIGPAAIDGAITGRGALTGTLAQPRADLTAAIGKISARALNLTNANLILSFRRGADASDGRVHLTAGSNYGPARASGNFYLGGNRIRLSDVDLDAGGVTAAGAISLSNNFPSSADLTFSARPGAFLASGTAEGRVRLTDGAGPETAILDVTGQNVRLAGSPYVVRSLNLNGRGTLSRLPFTLRADVGGPNPVAFDGSGVYSREGSGQAVTLSGAGRVREIAFNTRSPAVLALNGDGRVARVDLGLGGGVLTGELRQDSHAAVINANLTAVELGSLVPTLRGQVTGQVALRGAGPTLTGSANVALQQLRSIDAPRGLAVDGTLTAELNDSTLRIQARAIDEGAVEANADLTLPVEASAAPLRLAIARTRAMSGDVSINGQIQPIWDLFLGGERSLAGDVTANASLGGTINEPRINGRFDLRQGSFRDNGVGLRLTDMTLASRFDDTTALIEQFSAGNGEGGTVTGQGRLGLRQGSGSTAQLQLTGFQVIDNDIATAKASGPITIVRANDGNITLAGQINIDEALIQANPPGSNGVVRMDVVEINKPGGDLDERQQTRRSGPSIAMDIQLRSPGGDVVVRGRGLNVEMSVNARVTGTIAAPVLSGRANVVRGDYDFASRRFIFDRDGYVTLSTRPELIRLNLTATREDPALTATIRVTGSAARPEIALTSTPALPQDEVLSQVLFGRSASQLSPLEAAQLASAVAGLAGGGGLDVIGNLRQLAGLDRLSFGGEASSLTVAGGRYITDDVYLEVIGGGEGGAAVNLEWQVRRNVAVSAKVGGQGESSLSVRWRNQSRQPGTGRRDTRPNRSE